MRSNVASATESRAAALAAGAAKSRGVVATTALVALAALAWLVAQHLSHPFHLQLMEGVMQQHVERLLQGEALYPRPSPEFLPFAYNPLLYLAAVPPALLGLHPLTALRFVAVVGLGVALLVVAGWTRERTGSWWWGLVAAGLLAGSYEAMDSHLDVAQADSWLLATGLLGSWILSRSRSSWGLAGGMLVLAAGFWFKQHGAWFMLGGLLYATWRGQRQSWPAWVVALAAGPGLYLAGNSIFGPWFHFFTWTVPAGWSSVNLNTVLRPVLFLAGHYPILLAASMILLAQPARGESAIIRIQLAAALITAAMGSLDAGSSDNVFIPAGGWLILAGVFMLARLERRSAGWQLGVPVLLMLSFAVRFYNPAAMRGDPGAGEAYADLVAVLRELPGQVYAPYIAELPGREVTFQPATHWVALRDLSRTNRGAWTRNMDLVSSTLAPVLEPGERAWILTNVQRIDPDSLLDPRYTEVRDFGDRFAALQGLPGRFDHGYPRFLYVYKSVKGEW